MNYAYIGMRSLTYAQGAVRMLDKKRFHAAVARMPMQAESRSCAYSVRLRAGEVSGAMALLKAAGMETGMVYYPPADDDGRGDIPRRTKAGGP